ncbi:TPA: ATP-binding cassette domain-containing protein [Candidatus Poribacteria bacterium]|nr:ATP-binding cassette domain-containing protein [Candidatus Poribacteria bacterium]
MDDYAIETFDITKEFKYFNPYPNSNSNDMWWDYLTSWITSKRKNIFSVNKQNIVAVDAVNLRVNRGEFFGLLGPNGAGKTTLIKMLATIFLPTSGTAKVNGYDLLKEQSKVKASVNVVQSGGWLGFDHHVSIRWNLIFWARMYGLRTDEAKRRVDEALSLVGLEDKAEESSGVLSSGMRQRLAIAKGLLVYTPIFLLDEPTVGLDPNSAYAVRDFIKHELNRKLGQTVVLTTHYMFEAEQFCDRVAILDEGRIIACDTPEQLKKLMKGHVFLFELNDVKPDVIEKLRASKIASRLIDRFDHDGTGTLRVQGSNGSGNEQAIKQFLEERGCKVTLVKTVEPTLEDVFMHLTGKEL